MSDGYSVQQQRCENRDNNWCENICFVLEQTTPWAKRCVIRYFFVQDVGKLHIALSECNVLIWTIRVEPPYFNSYRLGGNPGCERQGNQQFSKYVYIIYIIYISRSTSWHQPGKVGNPGMIRFIFFTVPIHV